MNSVVSKSGMIPNENTVCTVGATGSVFWLKWLKVPRAACIVIDCAVPVLPVDVIFEDSEAAPPATQLSAR